MFSILGLYECHEYHIKIQYSIRKFLQYLVLILGQIFPELRLELIFVSVRQYKCSSFFSEGGPIGIEEVGKQHNVVFVFIANPSSSNTVHCEH